MTATTDSCAASELPAPVRQALVGSQRVLTACGAQGLVWHVWGSAGGAQPPLVLLHGGSGSWTHWLRNIGPLVASGRWVLVPDLPGFGDSALPPAGKDADAMPEPLEQGLQTLVGSLACEVVGFSFGGMVAGLWSQAFDQRFSRLVLVGPPGLGRPAIEPIRPKAWRHLSDAAHRLRVHTHNLRELMFHHEASLTELACQLQQLNAERDRLPHRRLARTDVLAQALQQVQVPVHLIYGQQDRYYLRQTAEIETVMRHCPGFVAMNAVPDAGHWVQFERPTAFHAALGQALGMHIGA
jgi:2-hydroxy-6-oxonona-2,4-dienedioate hydrolase